ncbi:molybdopterin molybdenumtransferase MoeA [Geomonas sp. Red276]
MPEMFNVLPPADALKVLLDRLAISIRSEDVPTADALGRVLAGELTAPHSLPAFPRSTMDGYAVLAESTYGATETLPACLAITGEAPMGRPCTLSLSVAEAVLVHTGGMIPQGADAVVMVERTQKVDATTLEVLRPVAPGENVVGVGEDVMEGCPLFPAGHLLRPQDIGGLMALGLTTVKVAARPRVAIVSTGDEVVHPDTAPGPGQIRDINSYTVASLVTRAGGIPILCGIVGDDYDKLLEALAAALDQADMVVVSAGSSVSARDLTAKVVGRLGDPGVVVHGVAVKPGKPTILAACGGKPVVGLPGNPVSAMVVASLFVTPVVERLQGMGQSVRRTVIAKLTRNVPSAPGREDYVQARLVERDGERWAEPVFGKSNLIYTLVRADGTVKVPLNASGLYQGDQVEVELY